MPIEADDGGVGVSRQLAQHVGQQAPANLRLVVLHGRCAADRVQHLFRAFDDTLLLGGDEVNEKQSLLFHELLPCPARHVFGIGMEPKGREHGYRDDDQQP